MASVISLSGGSLRYQGPGVKLFLNVLEFLLLWGGISGNRLAGGAGTDSIDGHAGDDTVVGGAGGVVAQPAAMSKTATNNAKVLERRDGMGFSR